MVILGNCQTILQKRCDNNGNERAIMYRYGFWSVQIKQIDILAICELRI